MTWFFRFLLVMAVSLTAHGQVYYTPSPFGNGAPEPVKTWVYEPEPLEYEPYEYEPLVFEPYVPEPYEYEPYDWRDAMPDPGNHTDHDLWKQYIHDRDNACRASSDNRNLQNRCIIGY